MRLRSYSILCLVVLCAAGMVYYHLGLFVPAATRARAAQGFGNGYSFGADLYPIWLTSRETLLHHQNPYSREMTRQIQIGLFGKGLAAQGAAPSPDYRAFSYPVYVDLLFWPLALLPFPGVRIGWAVILCAITAISVVLWLRALRIATRKVTVASLILLTLSSYAVLEGLFAEQAGLVAGFLLAGSLAALVGRRLFLSGGLLGIALIKPQMIVLVALYLLLWSSCQWRERWRFAAGFLLMAGVFGGSSLLVWPGWIGQWLQVILGYRRYSTPPLVGYLAVGPVRSFTGPLLIVTLLAIALAFAWRMRIASAASPEFMLTVSLLFAVTTVAVLPGHAVYDHVVLLPGILLIGFWHSIEASKKTYRLILGLGALALIWPWICAPEIVMLRPILSPQRFSTILMLPIRTAASIPFCVLALLSLMAWHRVGKNEIEGLGRADTQSGSEGASGPEDPLQFSEVLGRQVT